MAAFSAIVILDASFSQRISNVALTAHYMPMLMNPHVEILMVLAVGSTIAGTMLIFGAAKCHHYSKTRKNEGVHRAFLNLPELEFPWALSIY